MNDNDSNLFNEEEFADINCAWIFDEKVNAAAVLKEKLADILTPGFFETRFTPEEADLLGAFVEDALSEQDIIASHLDLVDVIQTTASTNTNEKTELN